MLWIEKTERGDLVMKLKKMLALGLAMFTMAAFAAGCGNDADKDKAAATELPKKIVIGLDDNFPPMGFRDDKGEIVGFDIDLAKEVAMQSASLDGSNEVIQLHWGGGTPTFLSHDEMRQLMGVTREHFRLLDDGEYSIEVDPRKVDTATVALLPRTSCSLRFWLVMPGASGSTVR